MESEICRKIPHRPPFLWIDRVLSCKEAEITAEKHLDPGLAMYAGHYPGHPITPGVILCEAVFQAAAVLIAERMGAAAEERRGVPVLTRIYGARFKREVPPGSTILVTARLMERMAGAWIMKGAVRLDGKTAVRVEFACALKGDGEP